MAEQKVDTTRLQHLARAYAQSAVFFAALDLEFFTHVAAGATTEAALAKAMDISPLNTERMVNVLLAQGLLVWQGHKLANAPDVQRFLVKGEQAYAKDWMLFTRPDVPGWFELTAKLRDKTPPSTLGMYEHLTVAQARAYHASTYSIGMGAGRRFVRTVDLSGRRKLLDLGGGSGAYSINAVQTFPGLSAVVLDLPPVTEVTQEYVAQHGVSDKVSTLPGDFTRTPFPTDVDCAVMASNLPIYNAEMIQLVVQKAHDCLLPGGEFHLVGEMMRDDRSGPLDAALWGLQEILYGSSGRTHTIAECRGYVETAGFATVTDVEFVPGTLHRVTGIKAG